MTSVVLLHPVGLDGRSFQFLTSPELADAKRYDCLWHGGRPKPAASLTVEAMADDLAENTTGPLHLVGVSMGGQVAQQVAMRYPDRVRSLMMTSGANPTRAERDAIQVSPHRQRAAMVMTHGIEYAIAWALARWFTKKALSDRSHPGVEYVRERLRSNTAEQFAAGWRALAAPRPTLEEQATLLSMPTTILHPSHDHMTFAMRRTLVDVLAQARLVSCEGPHLVHLEEPKAFEIAVLEHLDWVRTLSVIE